MVAASRSKSYDRDQPVHHNHAPGCNFDPESSDGHFACPPGERLPRPTPKGRCMKPAQRTFPFLTLTQAISLLRVATAVLFMAHALVRINLNTIPQFAQFLATKGWPLPLVIVLAVTVAEIVCGVLLITRRYVRWAVAPLLFIDLMGIIIIHAPLGWFVGEHGTGGVEYSIALAASLITIAAAEPRPTAASPEKRP